MSKVSYESLREYLLNNGRTINHLRKNGIINSNAAKQLAEDDPVSLRVIADICQFLNLPIEDVVEVKLEHESSESE